MIVRGLRTLMLAALPLLASALPVAGQSLTSIRGLGYPVVAADARAQVMGGLGIGLKGMAVSMINPAAAAGTARRGASISVAAVEQEAALGGASAILGSTRFPLIQLVYPVRNVVVTAGYGGYLDQGWEVTREGEQVAGGEDVIAFQDYVGSAGGVGQLRVGAAVPVGSRLAVGAAIGVHTGSQRVNFRREFTASPVGSLDDFIETRGVRYSGPMAQIGVRWDPLDIVRLGGSLTWAGTLSADSTAGPSPSREYDLPLQAAAGASATLAPGLLAALSGRWSGWSAVGDVSGLAPGVDASSSATDTWEVGGGLEWAPASSRSPRTYPVRLGGQYRQLPFTFGAEAPTEWFIGGGVGMRLGASPENPLAALDLTVQRGERTATGTGDVDGLVESAWRFTLSLAVFGN